MLNFATFTKSDWQGLAGAAPFEDGSDPLIASLRVDNFEAFAVLDNNGLAVFVGLEADEDTIYVVHGPRAARAVALLTESTTSEQLKALGLTEGY